MPEFDGRPTQSPADLRIRRTCLTGRIPAWRAVWRRDEGASVADPTPELIALADEGLRGQGLSRAGDLMLIRHEAGETGLPRTTAPGPVGFTLDLTDGGPTIEGGLLLFVEPDGRVVGWRSEVGALTTWSGADPLITEPSVRAPGRIALFGRARPIDPPAPGR